jgi:hypothetical protein
MSNAGACVKCYSMNTEIFQQGGHYRKRCLDCDHVGGPYISNRKSQTEESKDSIFDF